jgi:hypothetical protein
MYVIVQEVLLYAFFRTWYSATPLQMSGINLPSVERSFNRVDIHEVSLVIFVSYRFIDEDENRIFHDL